MFSLIIRKVQDSNVKLSTKSGRIIPDLSSSFLFIYWPWISGKLKDIGVWCLHQIDYPHFLLRCSKSESFWLFEKFNKLWMHTKFQWNQLKVVQKRETIQNDYLIIIRGSIAWPLFKLFWILLTLPSSGLKYLLLLLFIVYFPLLLFIFRATWPTKDWVKCILISTPQTPPSLTRPSSGATMSALWKVMTSKNVWNVFAFTLILFTLKL